MRVRIHKQTESSGTWWLAIDVATERETPYATRYGEQYLREWLAANGIAVVDGGK